MRVLLVGVLVLLCLGGLWAQDIELHTYAPGIGPDGYGWHPSSLDIGGQHILTFRVGSGKLSPADRRNLLEFRLTRALTYTEWRYPVTMSYRKNPAGMGIYANGLYFVTVTPDDAKINKSTVRSLARQWGRSIKRAFEIVGPSRQLPHTYAAEPKRPISLQ